MILFINLIMGIVLLAWIVYLWKRNDEVYKFRKELLERINNAAQDDIKHQREWEWRYDEYNSVSYFSHVMSFEPVRNFYPDRKFITKGAVKE